MHRVLVVEDDLPIANMYRFKLEQNGFDVRHSGDGADGLVKARQFIPHLILLDLKMPVMNGDDMLEKLRAAPWGSAIRIIVLTNISKDEAPLKLRFLNVDRYIVKAHYTPTQVLELVRELLNPLRPQSL